MVVVVSSAVISTNVLENIRQTSDYYSYSNSKNAMSSLYNVVQDVLLDINGTRHFTYSDTNGYFIAHGSDNSVKFITNTPAFSESFSKKDNALFIRSGPSCSAYFLDINNDKKEELILENDAVLFAVEHIGSTDTEPYTLEPLTNIISFIQNKQTNVSAAEPVFDVSVDGVDVFAGAIGYTELLYHPTAVSNVIHVYAESLDLQNAGFDGVDIYFSLGGADDFIETRVVPG